MSGQRKKSSAQTTPRKSTWLWPFIATVLTAAGLWIVWPKKPSPPTAAPTMPQISRVEIEQKRQKELFSAYAGSQSCQKCHTNAFAAYQNSHHAMAERLVDFTEDKIFFEPKRTIQHATQRSEIQSAGNRLELIAANASGQKEAFALTRVIGVEPLRQFLTPTTGGRLQVTELAVDPVKHEWFDIFGNEDRRPGEWGHWTGRGMNWNNMCASCHNTRVLKNFDAATDSYATAMAEATVGCEACHGPMRNHVVWQEKNPNQKNDPTVATKLSRDQIIDNCGSCHSRRGELTGDFHPGEKFFDHFTLTIPDDTEIYYADGQVHEEDYEFASFLGSKMFTAGIRCIDCHDPHSGKTKTKGDTLCLTCHGPSIPPAPKIDPIAHGHHKPDTDGNHCVDCHMPQTTYMQRHARRDHGFTIPDPLLTKKLQIPNACDRCHKDKGIDWQIDAAEKWYGPRMERPTRKRAEAVAEARTGKVEARDKLLAILAKEKIAAWRASEILLLRNWSSEPGVRNVFVEHTRETNALVRATSLRALEPFVNSNDSEITKNFNNLTTDPVRAVRIEAAWALRSSIETNSAAGQELLHFLTHNLDQPSGVLQMGSFYFDRGETEKALAHFERAVNWDTNSAPLHHALAVALSSAGQHDRAIEELKTACELAPNEAEFHFKLGLALAESGNITRTISELETAVRLNPQFAQAWYNLGLARAENQPEVAVNNLLRAESADPNSARAPYARATILARLGRIEEARKAAQRALEIQPSLTAAASLLDSLSSEKQNR